MEDPRRSRMRASRRRAGVIAIVFVVGVAIAAYVIARPEEPGGEISSAREGASDPAEEGGPAAELSDEELVDQVLLLGFEGTDEGAPLLTELRERQLGGVLIATANWSDASGSALVEAIRRAGSSESRVPPLVVTSQEGGPYRALPDLPPAQTQLEISDTGSIAAGEEWAAGAATALADAGIDLNLFPIADVATLDSPIADRAFSDDPAIAAQFTAAAVRSCRSAGLACAAAHFPGLGGASQDTNQGPATVSLDRASLAARDLEAFRAADAERVPAVVLSLAFYASYDPVTPGALSESIATELLRDEFGFEGLAITDDLDAGAVKATTSVPRAAVEALVAGADMVQIGSPDDQEGVREALLAALDDGELARERLIEAAGRVLELKRAQGLLDQ